MISKTYPLGSFERYKYVVIMSHMDGGFLLSRHKQRTTWEFQGGHIELGETPMQAARRELFEESGATAFDTAPLCDYWAGSEDGQSGACGVVFTVDIHRLGALPESEMAETRRFERLPENMTYPEITAHRGDYGTLGKKIRLSAGSGACVASRPDSLFEL